jgi:class 3 adenylate cyclase
VLERLIVKTGALLAIGFGEAGTEIIGLNMNKAGAVNPLTPGRKVFAVFGFCDIRSFSDITEALEEEVMLFVNEIAEIVHSTVASHEGSINK